MENVPSDNRAACGCLHPEVAGCDHDQSIILPDTSSWVRRATGDVIEAGTPFVVKFSNRMTVADPRNAAFVVGTETEGFCTYWTPPPVKPKPWEVISTDPENPTLARIVWYDNDSQTCNVYLEDGKIYDEWEEYIGRVDKIISVEVLKVLPEDHVAVPVSLIERAYHGIDWRQQGAPLLGADLRDVLASDESSDTDGVQS